MPDGSVTHVSEQLLPISPVYTTREVLKNIVRGRYLDPTQFLSVSSINAQFSVGVKAGGGVTGIGADTAGTAQGQIGYSDSPTITYVPQVGAGLYKSLGRR